MNFAYNPISSSSSTKLLSATLTAKLQRCHMESLQKAKKTVTKDAQRNIKGGSAGKMGSGDQQLIKTLEDDHIEQMIEELLDYGSIELSPLKRKKVDMACHVSCHIIQTTAKSAKQLPCADNMQSLITRHISFSLILFSSSDPFLPHVQPCYPRQCVPNMHANEERASFCSST
ncbi:hypothetical protein LguiB_008174 [Lonicera macranthoides]